MSSIFYVIKIDKLTVRFSTLQIRLSIILEIFNQIKIQKTSFQKRT